MKELKSIEPVSLGKILGAIYAVIGFIMGLFVAAFSGIAGAAGIPMAFFGVFSIVILPIVFGIMGFVMGIISALIYNIVAKKTGGVMLDL